MVIVLAFNKFFRLFITNGAEKVCHSLLNILAAELPKEPIEPLSLFYHDSSLTAVATIFTLPSNGKRAAS